MSTVERAHLSEPAIDRKGNVSLVRARGVSAAILVVLSALSCGLPEQARTADPITVSYHLSLPPRINKEASLNGAWLRSLCLREPLSTVDVIERFGGARSEVTIESSSRISFEIHDADVEIVVDEGGKLHEPLGVVVYIESTARQADELTEFVRSYAACGVVVSVDGHPRVLEYVSALQRGLLLVGAYESVQAARRDFDRAGNRIAESRLSQEREDAFASGQAETSRQNLLLYKCNGEFQAEFRRTHPGLSGDLDALVDDSPELECAADDP